MLGECGLSSRGSFGLTLSIIGCGVPKTLPCLTQPPYVTEMDPDGERSITLSHQSVTDVGYVVIDEAWRQVLQVRRVVDKASWAVGRNG